jgi:hypothetical protein
MFATSREPEDLCGQIPKTSESYKKHLKLIEVGRLISFEKALEAFKALIAEKLANNFWRIHERQESVLTTA